MSTESEAFTELSDEFALVAQTAAEAGTADGEPPQVGRAWVNVPAGGHVSGVFWGHGHPEVAFLHDLGESARAWDSVAVALGRPSVAIDLPGHGRSDWRRDGRYAPARLASAVTEAIRSFAPRARLIVGNGLGGQTALALRRRQPPPGIALLSWPVPDREWPGPEQFDSPAQAQEALAARRPGHSAHAVHREVQYELSQKSDGTWAWRHHPGNLPPPGTADIVTEAAQWEALGQLGPQATVIRGDTAGSPNAIDLERLRERAPHARVITISGGGANLVATQSAALAAALAGLVTTDTWEQR